jgi:hypothetical protein
MSKDTNCVNERGNQRLVGVCVRTSGRQPCPWRVPGGWVGIGVEKEAWVINGPEKDAQRPSTEPSSG